MKPKSPKPRTREVDTIHNPDGSLEVVLRGKALKHVLEAAASHGIPEDEAITWFFTRAFNWADAHPHESKALLIEAAKRERFLIMAVPSGKVLGICKIQVESFMRFASPGGLCMAMRFLSASQRRKLGVRPDQTVQAALCEED